MKERLAGTFGLLLCLIVLAGCEMDDQSRYSAYQENSLFKDGSSARKPLAHTVSQSDWIAAKQLSAIAGNEPVKISRDSLRAGAKNFNVYCSPCHDELGNGNGSVIQRGFPKPPSLHSQEIRSYSTQRITEVTLNGKGASPAFSGALSPEEALEVASYVHALQRSQDPSPTDLTGTGAR